MSGSLEALDNSWAGMKAAMSQRRLAVRHLLAEGERVKWDATALHTTNNKFIFMPEGQDLVVIEFSAANSVSTVKPGRRNKVLSVPLKAGGEWCFEVEWLALRFLRHFANRRR
jgi:hypothetical protein